MKVASRLALIALVGLSSAAAVACGDDDVTGDPGTSSGNPNTDGGGSSSGTNPGDGGTTEFVEFVKNQIVNETKGNTPTVTLDDKTFTDSERSDLFDPAFFAGSYEK